MSDPTKAQFSHRLRTDSTETSQEGVEERGDEEEEEEEEEEEVVVEEEEEEDVK